RSRTRSTPRWRSRLRARKPWCGRWKRCASWCSGRRQAPPNWPRPRSRCPRCRAPCWNRWIALSWKTAPTATVGTVTAAAAMSNVAADARRITRRQALTTTSRGAGMAKELHIVGFRIGRETFGVPIALVHEIVRVPEITAVPDSPGYVEGVINLRGKIVSVIDLLKRFGEKEITANKKNRIMVTEVDGKMVGLIVDAASEVLKIAETEVELPPNVFDEGELNYVTGVGKLKGRLIILVDL